MFRLLGKLRRSSLRLTLALAGGSIPVALLLLLTAAPDAQAAPLPRPLAAITPGTTVVTHTSATTHEMSVYADGRISDHFLAGDPADRNQIDYQGDDPEGTTIAVMFDQHALTSNAVDVGAQGEFIPTTPITLYTSPDNNFPRYSEDTSVVYASGVLSYQIAQRTLATTTNNCVIMELDIQNTGSSPLTGGTLLYMVDIDAGRRENQNQGFYDPARRFVYQSAMSNPPSPLGFAMGISLLKGDWRGYGIVGANNGYPDLDSEFQNEMITPTNAINDGPNDVSWIMADVPDLSAGQTAQLAFSICAATATDEAGARDELIEEYDGLVDLALTPAKTIDGNWTRRIKLTFNNSAQTENLIDFPVLVTLDSSRINYTQTQDAGQDIRFVDPDGLLLAHEIEEWNEAGTSYVWVKVPQIDGGSNTDYIWMYYGNPKAPDGQDPEGVWAGDYRMVYHLADSSGTILDSTANGFAGTNHGTAPYNNGFIAGARDFDGFNDYVDLGSDLAVLNGVSQATLSAWIRPDDLVGRNDIIAISVGGSPPTNASRASLYQSGNDAGIVARAPDSQDMNTVDTTSNSVSLNWHYVVAVIDYANETVTIYVDGISQTLSPPPDFDALTTSNVNSANAALGSEDDGSAYFFNGRIDEARVAATGRSADWVAAQYASMMDNFVTYGSQEDTSAAVGQAIAGAPFSYTIVVTNTGLAEISNVVVTDVVPSGAGYVSGGSYLGGSDTVSWTIPRIEASESESVNLVVSTCQLSVVNESYRAITSTQAISSSHGTPLLTLARPPTLVAQFTHNPPTGTVGATIYFTSTSTTNGGPIVAWGWDFGDGDTASGSTASHVYTGAGSFSVTLTVTDTCGFVDTVTHVVDVYPLVSFSDASYTVDESAGSATITVTLNAAPAVAATVNYATSDGTATAPGDYTSTSGTLTFVAGTTVQTFTVAIVDDGIDETDETMSLTLSGATNATIGGTNPATLTIIDNDGQPAVSFEVGSYSVGEGAGTATITVTLNAPSGRAVNVSFATSDGTATAPADYTSTSGNLVFTPGVTEQTFTVAIVDDGLDETDETVNLTLSGATHATIGGTNPATLTIIDDDVALGLLISKTATDLNGSPLRQGDEIEYLVVVTNGDGFAHTNVIISDWMPQNTLLIAGSERCSPGATCTAYLDVPPDDAPAFGADYQPADSGGVVIASMGSLASGQVFTVTFRVQVVPNVPAIGGNVAVVESDAQEPLASSPSCPAAGCTVEAGLTATKVAVDVNGSPLIAGEVVEYRIVVTNGGAGETNVTITDTVPTNMALVAGSITCSAGASCGESGGEITASIGSLGSGDVLTLTFRAQVNACATSVGGNVAFFWSDGQGEQKTLPVYPPGGGVVLPCSADLYEDDDTPGQAVYLPVGSPHQTHTFCDDAADWHAFTALANEVYTITTSSWGLAADTFLTVIDTDGVTVWAVNDDCPGATDGSSCLAWTAPASGVYYVRITNRDGVVGCNTEYEVWIETRTPPALIYLPLVVRNSASADLSMDIPLGRDEAGLDAEPGVIGGAGWLSSGGLVLALVGARKKLSALKLYVRKKR